MSIVAPALILLIEDNPADVFLIKEALRTHGVDYKLEWVSDGEEAINHIESLDEFSTPPELIILDLNLPKVDGKDVLAHIRRKPRLLTTPVAVLTSSDSPHDRREAASLGATCYMKKSPALDEFLTVGATIRELLEGTPIA